MTLKTCAKCKEEKPLEDFFRRARGSSDGRMSSCKACKTTAIYKWRNENRNRWNDYCREESNRPHRAAKIKESRGTPRSKALSLMSSRKPENIARKKAYWKENPDKAKMWIARKNAKRRYAIKNSDAKLTPSEWKEVLEAFGHRCAYCRKKKEKLTIDHKVPIKNGGLHIKSNVVPACLTCNIKKSARDPAEFALSQGRLCW